MSTGYMKADDVIRSDKPGAPIKCRCYDALVYKVCPDPKDQQRVSSCQKLYEMGQYVSYDDYYLTEKDYLLCKK